MAKRRKAKSKRKATRKISYNVKVDRFVDEHGRFVSNITGLLHAAAKRQKKEAQKTGELAEWKKKLIKKMARKRKLKKRKRKPPPRTPTEHERFEIEDTEAGDVDDYLDSLIYRNYEYMDEEVLY